MSGAVNTIKKYVVNPIKSILSPPEPSVAPSVGDITETTSTKMAETAQEQAKRKARKKKETTQTVLTSPLGATKDAKTAITKLGGS